MADCGQGDHLTATAPRKRRILYVNYCMATGGIESLILDFVRLLPADEFEPHVAVFSAGGSLEGPLREWGVAVHDLGKREGVDARLFLRLRALLRSRAFDVVHSHNFSAWLYSTVAAWGLGAIDHVHTEHSEVDPSWRRYAAERWLSRMTRHVVAVSAHVQAMITTAVGIAPHRVKLIYNGVDTARFAPDDASRRRFRDTLGIGPEEVVAGIVARLAPIKNHETLLRAFRRLRHEAGTAVRLVVVGDGPERARLEGLARELEIADHTLFLGERRDIPDILRALDVYVLPSHNEGMNLTLLEAMSVGLPVVAGDVGGNAEIVEEGVTGFLVPPTDGEAMGERLNRLVTSAEARTRMGRCGRERVLRMFDQRVMLRQYLDLYRGTAARPQRSVTSAGEGGFTPAESARGRPTRSEGHGVK